MFLTVIGALTNLPMMMMNDDLQPGDALQRDTTVYCGISLQCVLCVLWRYCSFHILVHGQKVSEIQYGLFFKRTFSELRQVPPIFAYCLLFLYKTPKSTFYARPAAQGTSRLCNQVSLSVILCMITAKVISRFHGNYCYARMIGPTNRKN